MFFLCAKSLNGKMINEHLQKTVSLAVAWVDPAAF